MAYQPGVTIYCTTGVWGNNPPEIVPTSFTYQWQNSSDLVTWTNIGSGGSSYVIAASDDGKYIRCQVTTSNVFDSVTVNSDWIGPILDLGVVCQVAFGSNPNDANPIWTDVSPYLLKVSTNRAKQRLLQRFEAGTMDVTLNNIDRRFEPQYSGSPYYPNILPMKQIRFGFVLNGVTTWEYTGYVERWPQVYKGPQWAEVDITCVDGFELIQNHYLASGYATLTTSQGSNRDLVYTSTSIGYIGNYTEITYVVSGINTALSYATSGTVLIVNLATDGSGNPTSTANQVMALLNGANTSVQELIQTSGYPSPVALAPGSNGTGIVQDMAATALTGGTFVQQTTGQYISQIFDFVNWQQPRNIATGQTNVQAQSFANDGSTHAVDQIYLATQTENGQFFFSKMGYPTFLDRITLASGVYRNSQATFSDSPDFVTTFPYQDIQIDWDKDLIYNDVRGTRANGTNSVIASDSTSDTEYFTRTLSIDGVLNLDDADATNLAQVLLLSYKQPSLRYEPLVLTPGENQFFWSKLLALELLDAVTIIRHPPAGGPPIVAVVQIIGIQIDVIPGPATTTTWTISIDPSTVAPLLANQLILNDATYGYLDSDYIGY